MMTWAGKYLKSKVNEMLEKGTYVSMEKKGILIVLSGFSGAGKGTVVKELIKQYEDYALSVSMTTRAPREGETHGVEYFFATREEFEESIRTGGLLEYAGYCDNYYGTPKAFVEAKLAEGKNVILEIEVQGGLQIRERYPESLLLFVTPPSAEELERRLRSRGTETEENIRKRLARAAEEVPSMPDYDYIVINDKLQDCVEEIHALVDAAANDPLRKKEFIKTIGEDLREISKGVK